MRDGVNPSCVFLPKAEWPDLLSFLLERFQYMEAEVIKQRLQAGEMVTQSGQVLNLHSPYMPETLIWYYREVPNEPVVPFEIEILHQDEHLLVVDKPHFLATTPGGKYLQQTVLTRLRKALNNPAISPIHRLDKDTAGVLVFCLDADSRGLYQSLFQQGRIQKIYEAVAPSPQGADWHWPLRRRSRIDHSANYFRMCEVQGPANSETVITLLRRGPRYSLYQLQPLSGKKHQLRVHMNALGLPLCNDSYYPQLLPEQKEQDFSKPLQLLAKHIAFVDPITAQFRQFTSRRHLSMQALCDCRPSV